MCVEFLLADAATLEEEVSEALGLAIAIVTSRSVSSVSVVSCFGGVGFYRHEFILSTCSLAPV